MTRAPDGGSVTSSLFALNATNFFMADVRDGLGPFLGIYLQEQGWSPAEIGMVMTLGGLAGMAATTPAGAAVDGTRHKRAILSTAGIVIVAACLFVLYWSDVMVVAAAQVAKGVAAAAIPSAISGITLGLVGQRSFARQLGRNEAFNHGGNVGAAGLAGAFGYLYGIAAVFAVMAAMAAAAVAAVSFIDPRRIDYRAARGFPEHGATAGAGFSVLLTSKPLIVLATTLLLFHLGNAAMLPLLGQALAARGAGDPSAFTGATVVVAQLTMVPMAIAAAKVAQRRGYWVVILLALVALPVRGVTAAVIGSPFGLVPVQILDGVGAGLLGVAVPGLVARILAGTGHVNVGLGAVMTLQSIGAAISPALGGWVAERSGYGSSFLVLGGIALAALVVWIIARTITADACATAPATAAPECAA
jgi:MFS family permease